MKQFIQKNLGAIIAVGMVAGIAIFGFGLDWDQSQITWKANVSNALMWVGGTMFVSSFIALCASTGRNG